MNFFRTRMVRSNQLANLPLRVPIADTMALIEANLDEAQHLFHETSPNFASVIEHYNEFANDLQACTKENIWDSMDPATWAQIEARLLEVAQTARNVTLFEDPIKLLLNDSVRECNEVKFFLRHAAEQQYARLQQPEQLYRNVCDRLRSIRTQRVAFERMKEALFELNLQLANAALTNVSFQQNFERILEQNLLANEWFRPFIREDIFDIDEEQDVMEEVYACVKTSWEISQLRLNDGASTNGLR